MNGYIIGVHCVPVYLLITPLGVTKAIHPAHKGVSSTLSLRLKIMPVITDDTDPHAGGDKQYHHSEFHQSCLHAIHHAVFYFVK